MAQPFKVDIFSEEADVVSEKPPRPTNVKPLPGGRKKQWDSYKTEILKKKQNQPPKVNQPVIQKGYAKPKRAHSTHHYEQLLVVHNDEYYGQLKPPTKNNWQPIPAVQQSNTPNETGTKLVIGMERPNLKVVEGTAGSILLNLDKSKRLIVQQEKETRKPIENKEESKLQTSKEAPGFSSPAPNQQQYKPQSSGITGRTPASAFMKVDQQAARNVSPMWPSLLSIPKSFLTEKHKQQLQTQQSQSSSEQSAPNPPPTSGPVWEAKIPPVKTPGPIWSRFDQPPAELRRRRSAGISGLDQSVGQDHDQQFEQSQQYGHGDQSFGLGGQAFGQGEQEFGQGDKTFGKPIYLQPDTSMEEQKPQYSPSDAYADMAIPESIEMLGGSPDSQQSGSKRLSAFQRLGPVTNPKKPKLTINLLVGNEQAVREVVDESEDLEMDKYTPVLERPDIQTSLDDTVMKYIAFWPWKKPPPVRRTVIVREAKSMMLLELEQMEEHYEKDKMFFGITVTGYPESWNKEDVLDALLEALKDKSFIPCFIEFFQQECKFLVIRSKPALVAIHKMNFSFRKDEVLLRITITQLNLSVNQIDFIPRLILRKRLSMALEDETTLNLKEFTVAHDVSHFLYFPLSRLTNQTELWQQQSSVPWQALTKLVLSHNKITTLSGFNLAKRTPRLKHLDLSYNRIEGITTLLSLRELPLTSLSLEGNPLCTDYIDPERYTRVLKMMFSGLKEIDGVKLPIPGDFPPYQRNYSPPDAADVVSKLLETLFPLLDASPDERQLCEDLYMDDAVMTVTFMYKLRYGPIYRDYRSLFTRTRILDEGEMDAIEGASAIAKVIYRWPKLEHDPLTFVVDVLYHTDVTTVLRIGGMMKVTAETLAEDEHLLHFTRTIVLHSLDSREYKITNEMIYWDIPNKERAREAFTMTTIRSKNLSLKLDTPPDAELRQKLLEIFMKLTNLARKPSERCLEKKEWHLRNALEYFSKLLKVDNLEPLFE